MKEGIIGQMRELKEGGNVWYVRNGKKFLPFFISLTSKDGLWFVLIIFLLEFL